MSRGAPLDRLASLCWAGALLTLPLVGLDLGVLLLGRELPTGLQPSWVLLAGAVGLAGAARLAGPRRPAASRGATPRWRRRDVVLAALAVAAVALSAAGLLLHPGAAPAAERWTRYGKQVVQLLLMLAFAAQAAAWTRGPRRWAATRRLLAAGLLLQAGYAALQAAHFAGGLPWFAAVERWCTSNPAILSGSERLFLGGSFLDVPRLRGTACEPLYLGNYLLLALPLTLLAGGGRLERTALVAGAALLVATWARGAWLGALAAILAGLALWRWAGLPLRRPASGRRLAAGFALAGAVAALALVLAPEAAQLPWRRLLQSLDRQDWSNLTRLYSMEAGWRAFLASPLVGIGWGQFAFHFPLLADPLGLQSQFSWPVVNNFPLEILCETGLAGGAVLLAAAAVLGRDTAAGLRRPGLPGASRRRLALLAAANAGIWVQLLTFSQYNLPHIWVAGGLLLAALAEGGAEVAAEAGAEARPGAEGHG